MKNFVFIVLLSNSCAFVYSLDIRLTHYDTVRITDDKLFYSDIEDRITEEYDITWEKINGIDYLQFNYTGKFLDYYKIEHGIKRYLILYGAEDHRGSFALVDFIFFYDNNNEYAFGFWGRRSANNFIPLNNTIAATSEYREKTGVYKAENLIDYKILRPWVENAEEAMP